MLDSRPLWFRFREYLVGYQGVRLKDLTMKTRHILVLFGLSNPWMMRRELPTPVGDMYP